MSERTVSASTILVADDNWANLELLSGLLQVEGFEVLCAVDGGQALQTLRSGPIDLVLLDVRMPEHDGFAVCREVKSNPDTRLVPVVLVTSSTASADRIQGIECGADDFLNKPVNREELLARVRSLLRLKQFTDGLENAETVLFSLALSRLDLPSELHIALRRAGTVHDIGKVAVPSGYPDGLKGEEIPLTARILQTVDIYDALTTSRPYRKALSPKETFTLMHKEVERGWWDGLLVEELEKMVLGMGTLPEKHS